MRRELTRTAGPLGRLFGFSLTIGSFFCAVNAGWYICSIGAVGVGCVYVSKWEVMVYSSRFGIDWSKGGSV